MKGTTCTMVGLRHQGLCRGIRATATSNLVGCRASNSTVSRGRQLSWCEHSSSSEAHRKFAQPLETCRTAEHERSKPHDIPKTSRIAFLIPKLLNSWPTPRSPGAVSGSSAATATWHALASTERLGLWVWVFVGFDFKCGLMLRMLVCILC